MFYIYVLNSTQDNSIYIGYTNNLKRRFQEHNKGLSAATKHKIPLTLVYYEAYQSKADAKYRETNLKRHAKAYGQLKRRIANSLKSS